MAFRTVDDEIRANEMRGEKSKRSDDKESIVDVVEDAVTAFAKPLSEERMNNENLEERRRENDAEQH